MVVGHINEVVVLTGHFIRKCISVLPGPKNWP